MRSSRLLRSSLSTSLPLLSHTSLPLTPTLPHSSPAAAATKELPPAAATAAAEKVPVLQAEHAAAVHGASFQQRVEVAFENLVYTVMAKPVDAAPSRRPPCCSGKLEEKIILNDISGVCKPGEFLTIIGASGSGKTTLLNCLANYKPATSGTVLANGKPLTARDRHAIAYIPQDDNLLPTATVFDTLNLSAQLRLPRSWSAERKGDRVEELLTMFRLTKQRETLVGSAVGETVILTTPPVYLH